MAKHTLFRTSLRVEEKPRALTLSRSGAEDRDRHQQPPFRRKHPTAETPQIRILSGRGRHLTPYLPLRYSRCHTEAARPGPALPTSFPPPAPHERSSLALLKHHGPPRPSRPAPPLSRDSRPRPTAAACRARQPLPARWGPAPSPRPPAAAAAAVPPPRPPPRPALPHPGPGAAVTMVMAEATAVLRRNRPGTKAQDFYNWPDESFEEMDSTLAVQQYIQQNIRADCSNIDKILEPPEGQDEGVWKYEHLRQFCLELNGLAVKLQSECHPDTCTQMTATEQWIFLCAAHKTPKEGKHKGILCSQTRISVPKDLQNIFTRLFSSPTDI
ncbi:MOB-like protein phocein isoform X2 [Dromaius novaehollandiae]|uniref:MOB-like protein phocein isoform X2 n=1 Tax=Dromaius novaehollandiae TaxID=8790 RepID=UPI00311D6B00